VSLVSIRKLWILLTYAVGFFGGIVSWLHCRGEEWVFGEATKAHL
jgi:hypothetical protein